MKIVLKFKGNIYNLMRQAGYHPVFGEARPFGRPDGRDEKTGELIFARRLDGADYPRFHIYLKVACGTCEISLHLDQKKPIYKGAPAHAAEYEGEIVEKEAERIRKIL